MIIFPCLHHIMIETDSVLLLCDIYPRVQSSDMRSYLLTIVLWSDLFTIAVTSDLLSVDICNFRFIDGGYLQCQMYWWISVMSDLLSVDICNVRFYWWISVMSDFIGGYL